MKKADVSKIIQFLKKLKTNNNREWFEKNKPTYLSAKEELDNLLLAFHQELCKIDKRYAAINPKKASFRIYRDVRFSKNKSPYKTNMGAAFSPAGKMASDPGYYLHIEPGNSFLAAGMYMPSPEHLEKIRQEIDYNGKALHKLLKQEAFKKMFGGIELIEQVKTAPKGYSKEHPDIDLIRHKHFVVSVAFTDADVTGEAYLKKLVAACKTAAPFNKFLEVAIH